MRDTSKLRLLSRIAIRDPQEFSDRIVAILSSRWEKVLGKPGEYDSQPVEEALATITKTLGPLDWEGLEEIQRQVQERIEVLEQVAPFTTKHHGDFSLARVCYAACRLLKPNVVVETGVAYGVTTAFVLKALQVNGKGKLYSVDLPPLGENADAYVGYLVPEELRGQWVLYRGVSKRVLPKLLPQLGQIDLFIHDSLHTYRNIHCELSMITSYLARPALVVADDIQGNRAFADWVKMIKPNFWVAFREEGKDALAGAAVFM